MKNSAVIALLACNVATHAASYTTYVGDANQYQVSAIAADAAGNTYITGSRVIVPASLNPYSPAVTDVFVSKLDPSGNLTLLATFSGKGTEQANGIAVDPSGNIYIVGETTSTDFPLHHPLQSAPFPGGYFPGPGGFVFLSGTGFLMKLSADGTMLYSTYLGGTLGNSSLSGVAADSHGNAYVTGTTKASDYPHTPGMPAGAVSVADYSGAFFAKIDPAGSRILYAGTLTGSASECAYGDIGCPFYPATGGVATAVDPAGNAYIVGSAGGGDLPTTAGALLANGIGAFVAKVNAGGTGMVYVTYLGPGYSGNGGTYASDFISAIAADGAGNAYISGWTSDPAFPATPGTFQPTLLPFSSEAFVAKLNPTGSAMVWATFLAGPGDYQSDQAQALAIDPAGNAWVSGIVLSSGFPTTVSVAPNGGEFLAELNAAGSALVYSAVFPGGTVAAALAVDSSGAVHAGGATGLISAFQAGFAPGQTAAPWTFGVGNAAGGVLSGRLAPGELISIYGLHLGPKVPLSATFDAAGFLPTTLGGIQVTIDGIPAPLLYVSDTQINAVAPVKLPAGSSVELQLAQNGTPLPDFQVMVDIAAPAVFLNPDGTAAALNQDGTVNSPANPAPSGSYVSIWATGTGYFPGSDGQLATGANQFCSLVGYCEILQQNGSAANVSYIGSAPGMVNGVVQINFQVACVDCIPNVQPPAQAYSLSVNGLDSGVFSIYPAP